MKKMLSVIMAVMMLISAAVVSAEESDGVSKVGAEDLYEPVGFPSDWAKESVERAEELGITDLEKVYDYQSAITREEFCEIVYNYISNVLNEEMKPDENVQIIDTESYAVQCLAAKGIIKGKAVEKVCAAPLADGAADTFYITFAPTDTLTREEAAVILCRMVNTTVSVSVTELYYMFDDSEDISDWAENSIQVMCNMGVMEGVGNGRFAPKGEYTTEQAIATVIKVYKVQSMAE